LRAIIDVMNESSGHWYDDVVMPALLNAARRGYGRAMRSALDDAGFDDMPRLGMRLVGGIARNGPADADVIGQLTRGGERRARVVSALVDSGYIAEASGETYVLTERGQQAAAVSAQAAAEFEEQVRTQVGSEELSRARAVLGAMVQLSDPHFS
jgi:hypothetical protein